jgi:hypothetical protein
MPAAVRTGISRKLDDAFRILVDGHPSTQGTPLEVELRYYHKYYFRDSPIDFDAFLEMLARDLRKKYISLNFTLDWIRKCDSYSRIDAARTSLYRLRSYVCNGGYFKISFWDILWNLTEVSFKTFGIPYEAVGTSEFELRSLSRQYLLAECRARLEDLKKIEMRAGNREAERAFMLVDRMLNGVPIPQKDLCANRHTYYSPGAAYRAYVATAAGNTISPQEVGWTESERRACLEAIFPGGSGATLEDDIATGRSDPTAPVIAEGGEPAAATRPAVVPVPLAARTASAPALRPAVFAAPSFAFLDRWKAWVDGLVPVSPAFQGA